MLQNDPILKQQKRPLTAYFYRQFPLYIVLIQDNGGNISKEVDKKGYSKSFIAKITLVINWIAFLLFANKKQLPLYIITVYTGIIFALITDLLMFVYPLWKYSTGTKIGIFIIQLLNSFGIYFIVVYFFLQLLPNKQTFLSVIRYIFYWSIFAILLEAFYLYTGFIKHGLWWNLAYSNIADWILFLVFYFHHKWILKHFSIKLGEL